ncbi:rhomboid family intramembrane serine protease [Flavobacterium sp.]|uniref:rhomboid family intramembrane serine protease n=1 Tax=Flavobacterium sp. TaxID=239 RepID=UPI003B9B45C8
MNLKFTPATWLFPLLFVGALWLVFGIEEFLNTTFVAFSLNPRTFTGLAGVVCAPFLHADIEHLANNSVALLALLTALMYFYRRLALKVVVIGILLSGFITWVIGRPSYHLGASSLIYVVASFLIFKGLQVQHYRLVALSFLVIFFYGSSIWYMFPTADAGISWEGHLSGFIAGLFLTKKYADYNPIIEPQYEWQRPDYDPSTDKFMQRFDENGNFVNPPPPEPEPDASPEVQIIYDFKPKKEESN